MESGLRRQLYHRRERRGAFLFMNRYKLFTEPNVFAYFLPEIINGSYGHRSALVETRAPYVHRRDRRPNVTRRDLLKDVPVDQAGLSSRRIRQVLLGTARAKLAASIGVISPLQFVI